jgi:succinate dehydrogenase / fumarate reductase cytochrome b subunit
MHPDGNYPSVGAGNLAAKILNNGDFQEAMSRQGQKKQAENNFYSIPVLNLRGWSVFVFILNNRSIHMNWSQLFTSSVGKKFVMGLTGIFLVLFLVVHVCVNACIWAMDGGQMFNMAAHFLGSTLVPRILEIGLFLGFILHIVQAYILELQNRRKRSIGYEVPMGNKGSKWYSRYMGWLGTFVLLFLVVHLKNFWVPSRFADMQEVTYPPGVSVHDLFGLMKTIFAKGEEWLIVLYIIGCISLAFHLMHGFQSAFRSLGVQNKRYLGLLNAIGVAFSIIVPLAFVMMPISMYLDWV